MAEYSSGGRKAAGRDTRTSFLASFPLAPLQSTPSGTGGGAAPHPAGLRAPRGAALPCSSQRPAVVPGHRSPPAAPRCAAERPLPRSGGEGTRPVRPSARPSSAPPAAAPPPGVSPGPGTAAGTGGAAAAAALPGPALGGAGGARGAGP